jgi:hypothetical protein
VTLPDGRCEVHTNHYLSYWEMLDRQCYWCKPPTKVPWPTTGADGKQLEAAKDRQKIIDYLHSLSPEERYELRHARRWNKGKLDET